MPGHFLRLLLFLFLLVPSLEAWPQEASYLCRGKVIRLVEDTAAVAIETSTQDALSADKVLSGASVETLASDPSRGRYAFRFESPSQVDDLRSLKAAGRAFYPVYRAESGGSPMWSFGEIIVRLAESGTEKELSDYAAKNGMKLVEASKFGDPIFLLKVAQSSGKSAFDAANELTAVPSVAWAEPNFYGGMHLLAADPLRPQQSHLDIIHADAAWTVTRGDPATVVAILDEGIDIDHPDLQANVWNNPGEVDDGIDNDANGFTDDLHGWDFNQNDKNVKPDGISSLNAHGTAVAGLVAAVQDNGIGVSGIAPECTILPLRLFNGNGFAGNFAGGQAIRYGARYADVMNCSWGGGAPSNEIMDAIDYAVLHGRQDKGCLIFFASGNDGGNAVDFPGNYAWSVSVGETNTDPNKLDLRHEMSDFDENLTLVAPQGSWSTDISGAGGFDIPQLNYTSEFGGTSSSSPIAAAVAALILSNNPALTGPEAALNLINSLDNPMAGIVPNDLYGKCPELGYGRVNAGRAVLAGDSAIDDRLEPNDTPQDAAAVTSGNYPWLFLGNNLDYYKLDGVGGLPIRCSITYLSTFANLGIVLLNANQQLVATSTVTTNQNTFTASVAYTPPSDGIYYIEVFANSGPEGPYVLNVQASRHDDIYEPNQSRAQAPTLTPGAGTTYKDLILDNDDYYKVQMNAGEYLYALLSFNTNQADLGLEVLDTVGSVVRSSDDFTYGEQVDPYQATTTGFHFIHVYEAPGGRINREYSLHLAVSATPPLDTQGTDDLYENNDSVATAASITPGFYPNLAMDNLSGEAQDLFRFTAPAGKDVRVTLGWNGSPDLDVYLYGTEVQADPPNTPPRARSPFTGRDTESVRIPAGPAAADYWVDVIRFSAGHASYRLGIETLDPEPPSPWVAFFRFCEGTLGQTCDPYALRDWRGPLLSPSPSGYPGLGEWAAEPDPYFHPGSDGLAIDCANGGIYFPGNGNLGELSLGDRNFTLWARINAKPGGSVRTIAAIPGVWEFSIRADNTFEFTAGSGPGSDVFSGTGPQALPGTWQDVACVWDRTGGSVHLFASGSAGLVETVAPIGARSLIGGGNFHLGSSLAGARGLGLIEQVRYFNQALTLGQISPFSSGPIPAAQENWELYQ
jgi:subtilisin family serine protease